MKKKIIVLIGAALLGASLIGCGKEKLSEEIKHVTWEPIDNQVDADKTDGSDVINDSFARGELIIDQTFDLNIEPIGEVTFASYLPDDSENPLADVVFLIEQDGQILFRLPGVSEDNVNTEMFNQVEAVNFSDYNYDGYDDIILIISYYFGAGPQAATPHSTIRYYTGSETGDFTYEKKMSDDATSAMTEITIKTAKDFIGYKEPQENMAEDQKEQIQGIKSDIDPLYQAFLNNEISVTNPYNEYMELTVMDDVKNYETEFKDAQKCYALVDVNLDEKKELIFKISSYPSELMYILGIYNNELICFDVFETHTKNMAFGVYDYGMVWWSQNYDGFEMICYSYSADGKPQEARRFGEGDEADIAAHEGGEPEWFMLDVQENSKLDEFISGKINADGNGLYGNDSFNISELPMDEEEWDSYSIGDRIDLDNDGNYELILNGPYGGMYIDASDDGVKVFASGDGTASNLSYTYCDNEIWIVHSDTMHGGRKYYKLQKYSGADNIVESVTLEMYDSEDETTKSYYYNDNEISESEYNELYKKYLGNQ